MDKIFEGKQDFTLADDLYCFETKQYKLNISQDIFDDETLHYAKQLVNQLLDEYDSFLDELLDIELRDFYGSKCSDSSIKKKLGRPTITVLFKKDEAHPNWKFEYAGIIDFVENKLDSHMISIEFTDALDLDDYIQFNG